MFPKVLDSFYPTWLNHSTHTLPVVFILIESISVAIIYPKGIIGPLLTVSGICTYLLWFVHTLFWHNIHSIIHALYICILMPCIFAF